MGEIKCKDLDVLCTSHMYRAVKVYDCEDRLLVDYHGYNNITSEELEDCYTDVIDKFGFLKSAYQTGMSLLFWTFIVFHLSWMFKSLGGFDINYTYSMLLSVVMVLVGICVLLYVSYTIFSSFVEGAISVDTYYDDLGCVVRLDKDFIRRVSIANDLTTEEGIEYIEGVVTRMSTSYEDTIILEVYEEVDNQQQD